jgi:predicted enzyme involved in methoxymalonyl-ACP biosynthesis
MCVGLLFLTCPVLGRQVEYAFMAWVADLAEQRGATEIDIPFAPGRDNGNLQTMVESWGRAAHEIHNSSDTSERRFRLSVAGLSQRIAQEAPDAASLRAILSGLRSEPIQIAI